MRDDRLSIEEARMDDLHVYESNVRGLAANMGGGVGGIVMSFHTVPHRTVPYRTDGIIVRYRTVPYRTVPYQVRYRGIIVRYKVKR